MNIKEYEEVIAELSWLMYCYDINFKESLSMYMSND